MNGVRPCSNDCMVMQNDTFKMEKQRLSHAHSSAQVQGRYKGLPRLQNSAHSHVQVAGPTYTKYHLSEFGDM